MFTTLVAAVRKLTRSAAAPAAPRKARPSLETLEARDCPTTLAVALTNQAIVDAQRLVNDVTIVEQRQPTLEANAIFLGVNAIGRDSRAGNLAATFADVETLLTNMSQEKNLAAAYRLPSRYVLAANNQVFMDMNQLNRDYLALQNLASQNNPLLASMNQASNSVLRQIGQFEGVVNAIVG